MTNLLLSLLAVPFALLITELARPWFAFLGKRLWTRRGRPLRRWFHSSRRRR